MLRVAKVALVGACAWLLAGCPASELGLDPPADDVFYPTGLAVDPRGDILYVTNGNSDLLYNAGTLLALDLTKVRSDIKAFQTTGEPPAAEGGDERKACRRDVSIPYLVECRAPRYAYADQTIKLGNFGGQIAVTSLGSTDSARLFIPVRGEPSLTWINAYRGGGGLELNCGNAGPLERCAERYRLVQLQWPALDPGQPDLLPEPQVMPPEPYGVFADERVGALYLTGFSTGEVSLFDIHMLDGGDPEYADIHGSPFTPNSAAQTGAVAVAPRPCRSYEGVPVEKLKPEGPCDEAQQTDGTFFYVTSHYSNEVAVFALRGRSGPCDPSLGDLDPCNTSPTDLRIVQTSSIVIDALDPASDTRGLAFTEDGTRAFVVDRQPPGLVLIDTSLEDGLPRNDVIDAIALCPEPSLLYLKNVAGSNRAFVVCFAAGTTYVVDVDALRVLDTILVGQGPNAMAFALDDPTQPLAFVANYVENDIGIIDLLPGSPTEHQVIARIGYPAPVRSH
jgi:DNA-binding beta-propeller fold protein YncE